MVKAAHSEQLQRLFEVHLAETEAQAERLSECLRLLEAPARAKVCKGMAGLIEEGEEVIREGKRKEQTAADLALIGAAQRVEHYEMAAYTTARNLGRADASTRDRPASHHVTGRRTKCRTNCSIR